MRTANLNKFISLRSCEIINILLNYLKEINNAPYPLRYLSGKKGIRVLHLLGNEHITVICMRILVSWTEKFPSGY